jgi:hypothetical protein
MPARQAVAILSGAPCPQRRAPVPGSDPLAKWACLVKTLALAYLLTTIGKP